MCVIAIIGFLVMGSALFLPADADGHQDISTKALGNKGNDVKLDVDYETMLKAGYVYGDQMMVRINNDSPMVTLFCGSSYNIGYFESYAYHDQSTHKIMIGQIFGKITASKGCDVHISFLRHIDRLDRLGSYGTEISIGEASSYEQFCNFREVTAGGISPGMLYRSVDPLEKTERAPYADAFAKKAGIRHEIDICETAKDIDKRFSKDPGRYCYDLYRSGDVFFQKMSSSLFDNTSQIGSCFEYLLDNDGPFLIHCKAGKDRTGMVFILLEGICGASMDEVMKDYMQTMVNFYNIIPDSVEYKTVEKMMFERIVYLIAHPGLFANSLSIDWELVSISDIDIHDACVSYLEGQCGLAQSQIDRLAVKLTA